MPSSRGSSQPRVQTQVSHIADGFFPSEPSGKPKNTGVGSLSLLQGNFLTQESNWSLLHCRWILYQLSYQGSPFIPVSNLSFHGGVISIVACISAFLHLLFLALVPGHIRCLLKGNNPHHSK